MDVEKLEKLAELRDKGALTQEEFETEKKKLLNSEANIQDTVLIRDLLLHIVTL